MDSEKSLSNKAEGFTYSKGLKKIRMYPEEDVKEAVKRLKERININKDMNNVISQECVEVIIDKIFGDKLTK